MNWQNERVLVTGAGGFIGSHLVDRLVQLGASVTGFLRYNSRGSRGFLADDVRVEFGDLCDLSSVRRAVVAQGVIFHLGASISVPYSFEHADETMRVNLFGTCHVLNAARRAGCKAVVVTSSSEVYGSAQYVPIDEKHPKQPQSPYAASKIAADALALSYHAVHGLPVTVVRPFNTYGPRQSDRAIIPALIGQMLHRDCVEVGNLATTRDFTYVSDTVEGMIHLAGCPEAVGQEVNLGTGSEVTIGELVNMLAVLTGGNLRLESTAERRRSPGAEVRRLLSDNSKARGLGWSPKVELIDGLRRTIEFVRAHPELYDPMRYRI